MFTKGGRNINYKMGINYYSKEKMPEGGFKKGKCKCGKYYAYCGVNLGYCIECLDKMEKKIKQRIERPEYNEKIKDIMLCIFAIIILITIGGIILFA